MAKYILVIFSLFFLVGFDQSPSTEYPLFIKEQVKGNDVFVECVISNFTFTNRDEKTENKKGYGFLKVYLNNQKIDDIYTAAFIIKELPVGNHHIRLELVHNDGKPYGIKREFEVKVS